MPFGEQARHNGAQSHQPVRALQHTPLAHQLGEPHGGKRVASPDREFKSRLVANSSSANMRKRIHLL